MSLNQLNGVASRSAASLLAQLAAEVAARSAAEFASEVAARKNGCRARCNPKAAMQWLRS